MRTQSHFLPFLQRRTTVVTSCLLPWITWDLLFNVVVVVALLFYVHGKYLRSCRDGQLI